jgi:hypothetical protein
MDEEKRELVSVGSRDDLLISYLFSGIKAHLKIAETSELTKLFEIFNTNYKTEEKGFLDSLTFCSYTRCKAS